MEWLKKYGAISGSVLAIAGALSGAAAYADNLIDQRVKIQIAELVKQDDLKTLERRLNGIQEQTGTAASDRRVMQEQLQAIRQQSENQAQGIEKQLNLILKLIEQKQ